MAFECEFIVVLRKRWSDDLGSDICSGGGHWTTVGRRDPNAAGAALPARILLYNYTLD